MSARWTRRLRFAFSPATILPLLVLILIITILAQGWHDLRTESIGKDARQNLQYAVNLWQHGVYGESANGILPGYQREPFPNWVLAGHLKWLVRPPTGIHIQDLIANSDLLTKITQVNILYLLVLLLSLWGLCLCLIQPGWLANLLAMLVIYTTAIAFANHELNNLNTELPAAFLLTLSSLTFVLLRQSRRWGWAVLAGAIFGCLVLTKASGAYLALLLLPMLPLFLNRSRRQSMVLGLCVSLGFALTVIPWVGRNLIEFGTPGIAEGGGPVLLYRSAYNQMTAEEFKGAFYAYAPKPIQDDVLGPIMGYSRSQLECGGSLQRLQRSLPCDERALAKQRFGDIQSFYRSVGASLPRLIEESRKQRATSSEEYIRKVAIQRINAEPLRHLLVSLPLAWRGMWSFETRDTWFGVVINAMATASLLMMPWLGILLRKPDWVLTSMVGVGYFLFYALLSHFIPRYSEPLIPLSLVCLTVLLVAATRKVGSQLRTVRSRGIC